MSISFEQNVRNLSRAFSKITFGSEKLRKIEKIYATYGIDTNEKILAYIKGTVFFFDLAMDGFIITDQAMYYHPSHKDWGESNRIPFAEICKKIVVQNGARAGVVLNGREGEQRLLGQSLIFKNTVGTELVQFIRAIQKELSAQYTWAKQQQDETSDWVLCIARNEMREGRITENTCLLLDVIAHEMKRYDSVAMVQAEDIFRTCDFEAYQRYLADLPEQVSVETKRLLGNSREKFLSGFLSDLSNIKIDFSKDFLNVVSGNLAQMETLSKELSAVLVYVFSRTEQEEEFQNALKRAETYYGTEGVMRFEFFRGMYRNHRMKRVYMAIEAGQTLLPNWLDWKDSLGLTPLSYALILKQEEAIDWLLEQCNWPSSACPEQIDGEIEKAYDYSVMACYAGYSDCSKIIRATSDIAKALERNKKAIEKRIWRKVKHLDFSETVIKKSKDVIRTAERNGAWDKAEELRNELKDSLEHREELRQEIADLRQEMREVEEEIDSYVESALIETSEIVRHLRESDDALIKLLLNIFSNPLYLLQILSDEQNCVRMYRYRSLTFVISANIHIDLPYIEFQEKEYRFKEPVGNGADDEPKKKKSDVFEAVVKPHGTSWFSPLAHKNAKKLKAEYRVLAKQYHPDVCHRIDGKQVFQEILNEKASILESMKED